MAPPWEQVSYPRILLVTLALTIGGAVLIGGVSSTSVFGAYNPAWDGTSEFRTVADDHDAEPVIIRNTTGYSASNANATVGVILSPETGYTQGEAARIEQFVRSGGTLLVAEDVGNHSNPLLARIGAEARVDGGLLRDERFYGASPSMPLVTALESSPYTEGADQLLFNRGTPVEPNGSEVLAYSSNYSYVDRNLNGELDDSEVLDRRPVATIESLGAGEVVVVGDPSIFINAMIDREDNRAFVGNLVGTHATVLLDLSHTAGVPPLVAVQLALQRSALLQIVTGIGLVLAVSYWRRLLAAGRRLVDSFGGASPPDRDPDTETVEQLVAEQFPEWDRERVRHVTEEIMSKQQQGSTDDRN
ncbi:DUF4350 domain-containing protein [Halosimplex halobium]|uniref:DUF4350 domain-containing protein n=1 Tax=Halosimplex halobium TaxID=3396618 RepID=UPI003F5536DC